MGRKCGFVTIIGAPNVGKSTLINRIIGSKVSIVSPKVQTTRFQIKGVFVKGEAQIVFTDTPGIFKARERLELAIVKQALDELEAADQLLIVVDAKKPQDRDTQALFALLQEKKRKGILVFNKIDLIPKEKLLKLAEKASALGIFTEIFMISALSGEQVDALVDHLCAHLPESDWYYPDDHLTDLPLRLFAAEVTREKLFLKLREELPYALTVETEQFKEEETSIRIEQTIYVETENQRKIILGKAGSFIRDVGTAARQELEKLLETKVHLFLFVKVRPNWKDDPARYRAYGLDPKAAGLAAKKGGRRRK